MDETITEISKKNAETFNIVVKQQNAKIEDQQKQIDLMNTTMQDLMGKLTNLEQEMLLMKARSYGSGPTKT